MKLTYVKPGWAELTRSRGISFQWYVERNNEVRIRHHGRGRAMRREFPERYYPE